MAPGTTDTGIHYILDNLVLPILDEFKPEVLINSAGQDNHYSDPLARMKFTARGYAILNEKLRPDIAVLEGGYSIETALPYVNMGIIMAMAGIDYSNLREPDYNPDMFRESPRNMDDIKDLVETQLATFRSRNDVVDDLRRKGRSTQTTTRGIFYDTDGLRESQKITFRICPQCCGFRTIASAATHADGDHYTVFCIQLPAACCPACQDEAYAAYEQMAHQKGYDFLYLQDRLKDAFHALNITTGEEKVL
jgi:hypothetical protein